MVDVEEKVEQNVERKSGAELDMDDAAYKVEACTTAMVKKMTDPDRQLEIDIIDIT